MSNQKYLTTNISTDDFMNQLNYEICQNDSLNKNPKLFIKKRNITPYKFKKSSFNLQEDDLPIQTLLGSVFLIKNDNIIECYSWCDYNHSMYIQINRKYNMWIGKLDAINIDQSDSSNIKFILDGSDIFDRPDNYQYIILQFLQSGFKLYIKKSCDT
jgi:hypothetical protein